MLKLIKKVGLFKRIFLCLVFTLILIFCFSPSSNPKIGVIYIATGRYILFWDEFYKNAEENFLPDFPKTYFVFTDSDMKDLPDNAVRIHQEHLPWPEIVLKKYHLVDSIKDELKGFNYIYLFNSNLIPVRKIGEEILPTEKEKMTFLAHPGYWRTNLRPYENNPKSKAYIPKDEGIYYFAGGFTGGIANHFLIMAEKIKETTNIDIKNNVIAKWHDESHLNRYILDFMKNGNFPLILSPLYMIPEETINNQKIYKNLEDLKKEPKMILLNKGKKGHSWWRKTEKD